MKKKFVRQARLPKGAYGPCLANILSPYVMRGKKRIVPKVYKDSFGKYYILTSEFFNQIQLQEAYELQKETEEGNTNRA